MVTPSGEQHEIADGPLRAVVTQVGGGLRSLTAAGRDLVVPFGEHEPRRHYRGAVLAPWPNRVRDGRWSWRSADQQLALSEPARGAALHGLACWLAFEVLERTPSSLALGARVWPQAGWPGVLDLRVDYALAAHGPRAGLTWTVTGTNAGPSPLPWGTSVHPYLVAGPGRVDDWTVDLDADRALVVDPERLLPDDAVSTEEVAGTPLDLRGGRALRGLALDHAYTGLGRASARVVAADGSGVEMTWDGPALPWVQVHTADRPEPEDDRVGLALEPMTCPPDALRSGRDLLELAPGASRSTWWRIAPLAAPASGGTGGTGGAA